MPADSAGMGQRHTYVCYCLADFTFNHGLARPGLFGVIKSESVPILLMKAPRLMECSVAWPNVRASKRQH